MSIQNNETQHLKDVNQILEQKSAAMKEVVSKIAEEKAMETARKVATEINQEETIKMAKEAAVIAKDAAIEETKSFIATQASKASLFSSIGINGNIEQEGKKALECLKKAYNSSTVISEENNFNAKVLQKAYRTDNNPDGGYVVSAPITATNPINVNPIQTLLLSDLATDLTPNGSLYRANKIPVYDLYNINDLDLQAELTEVKEGKQMAFRAGYLTPDKYQTKFIISRELWHATLAGDTDMNVVNLHLQGALMKARRQFSLQALRNIIANTQIKTIETAATGKLQLSDIVAATMPLPDNIYLGNGGYYQVLLARDLYASLFLTETTIQSYKNVDIMNPSGDFGRTVISFGNFRFEFIASHMNSGIKDLAETNIKVGPNGAVTKADGSSATGQVLAIVGSFKEALYKVEGSVGVEKFDHTLYQGDYYGFQLTTFRDINVFGYNAITKIIAK